MEDIFAKQCKALEDIFSYHNFCIAPPPSSWLESAWDGLELHCISMCGSPESLKGSILSACTRIKKECETGATMLVAFVVSMDTTADHIDGVMHVVREMGPNFRSFFCMSQCQDPSVEGYMEVHVLYGVHAL